MKPEWADREKFQTVWSRPERPKRRVLTPQQKMEIRMRVHARMLGSLMGELRRMDQEEEDFLRLFDPRPLVHVIKSKVMTIAPKIPATLF